METATTEEKFRHAVQLIQNLPNSGNFQPSNDLKLKFYSLFKQATIGQCDTARPGFLDFVNRAKWDAWDSLGDMSKEEAMKRYVEEFVEILKSQPFDEKAHEYVSLMGPFIDFAPKEFQEKYAMKKKKGVNESQSNPDLITGQIGRNSCNERVTKPIKREKNNEVSWEDNPSGDEEKLINGHNLNGTKRDSDDYSDVFDQANEEFAEGDKMEHSAHAEKQVKISKARGGGEKRLRKTNDSRSSPILGSSGGSRGNHGNPHRTRGGRSNMPSHHYPAGGAGGGRRGDGSESQLDPVYSDVSEELAFAVIRLQHTMEKVVKRLDSLETLLLEKKSTNFMKGTIVTKRGNFFSNLFGIPLRTVLLILGWPFLAHWIIILVIQRRQRR